jgi:hypothetical protein
MGRPVLGYLSTSQPKPPLAQRLGVDLDFAGHIAMAEALWTSHGIAG